MRQSCHSPLAAADLMMTPARCLLQEEMSIEEIQQRAAQMRQQRAAAGGGKEGLVEVRPARLAPAVVRSSVAGRLQRLRGLAEGQRRPVAPAQPHCSLPPLLPLPPCLPACRV